jgi:hypothetical protein
MTLRPLLGASNIACRDRPNLHDQRARYAVPCPRGGVLSIRMATITLGPSEQLAYSTVRLEGRLATGAIRTGTGFMFRLLETVDGHAPVIVTNRHVVADVISMKFLMHGATKGGAPDPTASKWIQVMDFERAWAPHPDDSVDLAVIPIGPLVDLMMTQGQRPFFIPLDKSLLLDKAALSDLGVVEDVLLVGYPNGIWDTHNNFPIMRRGSTATHPAKNYDGQRRFLIDAAVFPGSSGSPVLLYNLGSYTDRAGNIKTETRVRLLGIVSSVFQHSARGEIVTVPAAERSIAVSMIPNNLGIVIAADRLLEFEKELQDRIARGGAPSIGHRTP